MKSVCLECVSFKGNSIITPFIPELAEDSAILVLSRNLGDTVLFTTISEEIKKSEEKKEKSKNSILLGLASFALPGLGQLFENRIASAAKFMFGIITLDAVALMSALIFPPAGWILGFTSFGVRLYSAYDAYNNKA